MKLGLGFSDRAVAYALFRVTLGLGIGLHAFWRLKLDPRSASPNVGDFHGILPDQILAALIAALPYAQTIIGALVVLGFFSRAAYVAGVLVILFLTFAIGSSADYGPLVGNLIIAGSYFTLLATREWDALSVDAFLTRRGGGGSGGGRW